MYTIASDVDHVRRLRNLHHLHFWLHILWSTLFLVVAVAWMVKANASTTTVTLTILPAPLPTLPAEPYHASPYRTTVVAGSSGGSPLAGGTSTAMIGSEPTTASASTTGGTESLPVSSLNTAGLAPAYPNKNSSSGLSETPVAESAPKTTTTRAVSVGASSPFGAPVNASSSSTPTLRVSSPTHPNAGEWYASNEVEFRLETDLGAEIRYLFNKRETLEQMPSDATATTTKELRIVAAGDGLWYFHAQSIEGDRSSAIVTLPVRADTTPPIVVSGQESGRLIGPSLSWHYAVQDDSSGVKSITVSVDGRPINVASSSNEIQVRKTWGLHRIAFKISDRAGNQLTEVHDTIVWLPSFFYTLPGAFGSGTVALLIFGTWIWVLFERVHPRGKRIRHLLEHTGWSAPPSDLEVPKAPVNDSPSRS